MTYMPKIVKYVVLSLWLLVANAYAEEIFPPGCKAVMIQGEQLNLSAKKRALVMIHNLSSLDLWVTHPVSEASASAGWSTRIQAGNWTALALDQASFELSCIESRPGHEQQVECAGLLSVCQYPAVKAPKADAGTFWAGEDMDLSALMAHVGSRGFVLPSKDQ